MSISVVINTYNAAEHLEEVLESVSGFNEIIVCDMESTDDTVGIAARHGARVVTFPRNGHTRCEPARDFAISQARCDWVLVVDDDETVPPQLRDYLYRYIHSSKAADGLYIPRRNFTMDRFRKDKYPDYRLRFFRQESVEWPARRYSEPIVKGTVDKIPSRRKELALIHLPDSTARILTRINDSTEPDPAAPYRGEVNFFTITTIPFLRFLNTYILRGRWRFGIPGLVSSVSESASHFYRLAKVYESRHREEIEKCFHSHTDRSKKMEKSPRAEGDTAPNGEGDNSQDVEGDSSKELKQSPGNQTENAGNS